MYIFIFLSEFSIETSETDIDIGAVRI